MELCSKKFKNAIQSCQSLSSKSVPTDNPRTRVKERSTSSFTRQFRPCSFRAEKQGDKRYLDIYFNIYAILACNAEGKIDRHRKAHTTETTLASLELYPAMAYLA